MRSAEDLEQFKSTFPNSEIKKEGEFTFYYVPATTLPDGSTADLLLCPQMRDGYSTKLFVSKIVPSKGGAWATYSILDRTWYSWSWQHIPAEDSLLHILANHLGALKC